jgi:DNA-binding transcriptional MerR regulator
LLHYYERKALLVSSRSSNGYREYAESTLGRVQLVRRALSVGFTLDELARLLRIRAGGDAPCREVRALAAAKLESVDKRFNDLAVFRDDLRWMIGRWDLKLARTPRGRPAGLLEDLGRSFDPSSGAAARSRRATARRRGPA